MIKKNNERVERVNIFFLTPLNRFKIFGEMTKTFYYVYVLKSKKDRGNYVGCTKNLKSRFEERQKDQNRSTTTRRPFDLLYYEACRNYKDALRREKYLKTAYGKRYIKNRLKSYLTG